MQGRLLGHIGNNVTDLERSQALYTPALAPPGTTLAMERGQSTGLGRGGKPEYVGQGLNKVVIAEAVE